jgi:transcriptional regulator with XRE-family HTH domain
MTPAELIATGEALWGKEWRRRMAEALPMSRGTISKWESGKHPVLELAARHLRLLLSIKNP